MLHSEKGKGLLQPKDLDTINFILSLYEPDNIDISEASAFLKNNISLKTPIEELALNI